MLEFKEVTKKFEGNNTPSVHKLNLKVERGEFVVFIGPSGCGKTTTMKMINRLIEPSGGEILVDGVNVLKQDAVQLRRSIGYVIQQIGLMPHMTVGENISLVGSLLKWNKEKQKERAKELISLVDLPEDYLDRYPHELSGGQQQRIGVLRALATNPPLILMDEPFGALDPITRDSLQEEFKKLQKEMDKTIVFVTHDMDEAIKLADKIVIMNQGEIVQVGTPDDILRHPANEFVEDFIGKDRLLESRPEVTRVEQIMNPNPITIEEESSLKEAIQKMHANRVDSLLVVDGAGILKGYIDIEMVDSNYKKKSYVHEAMDTAKYAVDKNSLLRDTMHRMLRRGSSYVPVVTDNNKLAGIVTRATLADMVFNTIWGDETEDITAIE
ncbi:glycine betaine/carnitine/choline transport ATP-binding protein OpuCA [Oceanobacillus oncorhynchi subsp. incaldanensis]|uniref:Quaternary amine transport ATP-binding protein n=2 Tax=Oceanobacillus TaxID=182709 RepID=A0A0A1MVF0_9BACI|nr:betaine/proline/choline family ABC transporter ATP-binding protein [Oceanobacillus oncorhynchi]MDM8101909.1 betaine/proline/choline family ABC transporter ATP-binding protein [Oceanobacillus oncorhynchi]UUI42066.1 betaine/proline/choline family ABC transporter ATP-binding protein [Oceanobacillus oncorhynchi]GIO17367.1 glycine betaine/carnitine/choline transport ATP-binding protein OpuCA [Oceanobacillus oncorhynchi subsp. incaldanensis]CEI83589.1 Glycine betaine/carnitine/choline transport AT